MQFWNPNKYTSVWNAKPKGHAKTTQTQRRFAVTITITITNTNTLHINVHMAVIDIHIHIYSRQYTIYYTIAAHISYLWLIKNDMFAVIYVIRSFSPSDLLAPSKVSLL